jgi:hypothetical protein
VQLGTVDGDGQRRLAGEDGVEVGGQQHGRDVGAGRAARQGGDHVAQVVDLRRQAFRREERADQLAALPLVAGRGGHFGDPARPLDDARHGGGGRGGDGGDAVGSGGLQAASWVERAPFWAPEPAEGANRAGP